jgi:hypothetical protein
MHRIAVAIFLLTTVSALAEPALTISCEDKLFAEDSTHERLVAAFGKQNVALISQKEGARVEVSSVIFPKDPKRKLTVIWDDPQGRTLPRTLIIEKPSEWTAPKGVRLGMPVEELEQLNGAPFPVQGFNGFSKGSMEWTDGGLGFQPGGCFLSGTLAPTAAVPKPKNEKFFGNVSYPSTDPNIRLAKPVLSQLMVHFKVAR